MISASSARARKYSAQRARVASMRRASLNAGRRRLWIYLARWPAAPEGASTTPRAAALVTLAIAFALGPLALLIAVAVLGHRPHREVDAAHAIDLRDLHRDLVAHVHHVLDAVDALRRELADADQSLLAREVLDERPDTHDPGDLALVDLADLGLLGETFDHRARL